MGFSSNNDYNNNVIETEHCQYKFMRLFLGQQ